MDRRGFLTMGVAAAAESGLFDVRAADHPSQVFPLSVASGDPGPHGIVLWTRVEPSIISRPFVSFQIATQPEFADESVVITAIAPILTANDSIVKVLVEDARLRPFTTYYYRFIYLGTASRVGRFKTLPEPGTSLSSLRIAFLSCQDFTNGHYTPFAWLHIEDVHYVVHLGDYIYESVGGAIEQDNQARPIGPLPSGNAQATTVDDYRYLYRTYRSDLNLQHVHEAFAFIAIWDDHEFGNDAAGLVTPDNANGPVPRPGARRAASQAWMEYIPAAVKFNPTADAINMAQIYRSFVFGDLAELVATDERLYRNPQPCGTSTASRYATIGCPAMNDPTRTMLGSAQKVWFLNRMTSSQAVWKIWANEVMLMPLRVINGPVNSLYLSLDQWDGYAGERSALLLVLAGVKNLVAITGDIHSFGAGYLKPNFADAAAPYTAIELVSGSISSANFSDILSSAVNPVSAPVPRERMPKGSDLAEAVLKLSNPHLEMFESSSHGYCVLEIFRDRMSCRFMRVDSIRDSSSTLQQLVRYNIPEGQSKLVRV